MLGNHQRVNLVIQSTLTINAVITWVTHHISPEAEAIAFMLSGIAAAWACDIERKLRHPHFWDHQNHI